MKKICFMFPGVGSQHAGMGRSFFDHFAVARDTFEEASDHLKMDLSQLCFLKSEETRLNQLINSQIALLTVSTVINRVYKQEINIEARYCLGHSLGEYSALCCSGVVKFADALKIVKERGKILNAVASTMDGIMAWVINLETEIVERVVKESAEAGEEIYISSYDSPTQSSISGPKDVVIKVGRKLEKEGAIVYPLKINGPFHCPLMGEAANKIREVLDQYKFQPPINTVIANRDAKPYKNDKRSIVENLSQQLIEPIHWRSSIDHLVKQGVEIAIEIGPDKVLKHLLQNNTKAIKTYSLENVDDLEKIKDTIET